MVYVWMRQGDVPEPKAARPDNGDTAMAKVKGTNIEYRVSTFKDAGLQAKWGKTRRGQPCIFVRDPDSELRHQRETWWMVTAAMAQTMDREGIREGFDYATLAGKFFSVPA